MKRTILFWFFLVMGISSTMSQIIPNQDYVNLDTIEASRCESYYYTAWYDQCPGYSVDSNLFYMNILTANSPFSVAIKAYCPQPLIVKGLSALVLRSYEDLGSPGGTPPDLSYNPYRNTEFLRLYQTSSWNPADRILLDSAQWDNVIPKFMKLPQSSYAIGSGDTTKYMYCYAFDSYFKNPVRVDSMFFIEGTCNSNDHAGGSAISTYVPTYYVCISPRFTGEYGCPPTPGEALYGVLDENWMVDSGYHSLQTLPFMLIIDYYRIDVESGDSTMGMVSGGGRLPEGWHDSIFAMPFEGYRFYRWDDGNRNPYRNVISMQDTSYTAYFCAEGNCYVEVGVNNEEWGTVTGGGIHPEGIRVTLTAIPADSNYEFISWADGNTDNPRIVVLTNDTMFSAIFACVDSNDTVAIRMPEYYGHYVSVSPNPAMGSAEVLSSFGLSRVEVFNAAGRKVMDRKTEGLKATLDVSKLPSGAYLLRIHTPQGMTTKKLVVR